MPVEFGPPGEKLSQGDIVPAAPAVTVMSLDPFVKVSGNRYELRPAFPTSVDPQREHQANAQEVRTYAIVLSHDCELDKPIRTASVLLGLVRPFANLALEVEQGLRRNTRHRALYLPASTYIESESYVDLRRVTTLRRAVVDALGYVASMNDDGKLMLQEQLFRFFTRRVLPGDWRDWEEEDGA